MINQSSILEKIPSRNLKEVIKSNDIKLSDEILFKIAYQYSDSIFERIKVADNFRTNSKDKFVRVAANELYNNLNNNFKRFIESDENTIYEINVNQKGFEKETFLSTSYKDALLKLKMLIEMNETFDFVDIEDIAFSIKKRTIYDYQEYHWINDTFQEIPYDVEANPIIDVFYNTEKDKVSDAVLQRIVDKNIWKDAKFPDFLQMGDLVSINPDKPELNNCGVVIKTINSNNKFIGSDYNVSVVPLSSIYLSDHRDNEEDEDGELLIRRDILRVPYTDLTILNMKDTNKDIKTNYHLVINNYRLMNNVN